MTTFESILLKCPHCSTLMSAFELMSYTVHSCVSWSDGKSDAGIPDMGQISICPACEKEFWKDDAIVRPDEGHEPQHEVPSAMDVYDLEWNFAIDRDVRKIVYYEKLINDGFADTDVKEFFLRTRLWWAINDIVRSLTPLHAVRNLGMLSAILSHRRKSKRLYRSFASLRNENLDALIRIYQQDPAIDPLYQANMFRERGLFRMASGILDEVERKDGTWRKLKKKVRKRNNRVFKL